jgi:TM2 domain-containing membrane protein YozV
MKKVSITLPAVCPRLLGFGLHRVTLNQILMKAEVSEHTHETGNACHIHISKLALVINYAVCAPLIARYFIKQDEFHQRRPNSSCLISMKVRHVFSVAVRRLVSTSPLCLWYILILQWYASFQPTTKEQTLDRTSDEDRMFKLTPKYVRQHETQPGCFTV